MSTRNRIDISLAEEGRNGEVRHYGGIAGDLEALAKVVKALRPRPGGCASSTRRAPAGVAPGKITHDWSPSGLRSRPRPVVSGSGVYNASAHPRPLSAPGTAAVGCSAG